jgi:hypothetical protein
MTPTFCNNEVYVENYRQPILIDESMFWMLTTNETCFQKLSYYLDVLNNFYVE